MSSLTILPRVRAISRWWSLHQVLVAAAAFAVAARVMPGRKVSVFGRIGVRELVWPLTPLLVTVGVGAVAQIRCRFLEATSRRSRLLIGWRFLAIVAAATVGAVLVAPADRQVVLARNCAIFVGLALAVMPATLGRATWMPGLAVTLVMFTLGTTPNGALWWAVIFRPAIDPLPGRVAAVALATGLAVTSVWLAGRSVSDPD